MSVPSTPTIVIDNGSSMCRAGFGGEEEPQAKVSSVVGRIRQTQIMCQEKIKDAYIGNEAQEMRGLLMLKHPIENGVIVNYDDMEKIFDHVFRNELKVNTEEHDVLLTEPPFNPNAQKEKLAQIMFETYGVAGLYISLSGVHSLYASGTTTGLVVMSGEGVTHTVPVVEGCVFPHSILQSHLIGKEITEALMRIITKRGYYFTTTAEREIVRCMKEALCYIALDYHHEMEKPFRSASVEKSYELPDGQIITIGNERYRASEALFQPDLIGQESCGLHETVFNTIMRADIDIRRRLYKNIILSGGNTMFTGFQERMKREIAQLAPPSIDFNITAAANRDLSEWLGGSILSSLGVFSQMTISKDEYDEWGPIIVHRKC